MRRLHAVQQPEDRDATHVSHCFHRCRSPGTGLYDNLAKYDLPEPTAVFDLEFFRRNPKPFYELARELWPGSLLPTKTHFFLRLLHEKGVLRRVFTQNIDTLETLAGVPESKLVHAHGSFSTAHCISCGQESPSTAVRDAIMAADIPRCKVCKVGVVKPDITFFGEALPSRFGQLVEPDMKACDLLIVMGTSLEVHPVANLPAFPAALVPRLLLNREMVSSIGPTPRDSDSDSAEGGFLAGFSGDDGHFRFERDDNYRDVFHPGDCDDSVVEFAGHLGWSDDLDALVESETARIRAEQEEEAKLAEERLRALQAARDARDASAQARKDDKAKVEADDQARKKAAFVAAAAAADAAMVAPGAGKMSKAGEGDATPSPSGAVGVASSSDSGTTAGAPAFEESADLAEALGDDTDGVLAGVDIERDALETLGMLSDALDASVKEAEGADAHGAAGAAGTTSGGGEADAATKADASGDAESKSKM